jgi:uncharacterized protein
MNQLEMLCDEFMLKLCEAHPDPSHDILHVRRVVSTAKRLAAEEGAELEVVVPAAYLHDCVYVSKTDARRSQASRISADHAVELLRQWGYPEKFLPRVHHAIVAHSFSAGVPAETLEAKVVQDADRLDAMGAVGAFRCFAFSGLAKRPLYSHKDPFCVKRMPDEGSFTLDHFYTKLFKLQDLLHTAAARREGARRVETMRFLLDALKTEFEPMGAL